MQVAQHLILPIDQYQVGVEVNLRVSTRPIKCMAMTNHTPVKEPTFFILDSCEPLRMLLSFPPQIFRAHLLQMIHKSKKKNNNIDNNFESCFYFTSIDEQSAKWLSHHPNVKN